MFARAGLRTLVRIWKAGRRKRICADEQNSLPRARFAQVSQQIAQRRALSDEARKLIDNVSVASPPHAPGAILQLFLVV